jgi:hypothetical protein
MGSNKQKSEQLNMSFGAAGNQLRKSIIFHLIQKCGLDTCYQCGKKITSVDELSIEHKVPWQSSSDPKRLFFDIENIAFSHLKCNVSASDHSGRYGNGKATWKKKESINSPYYCKYKGVTVDKREGRTEKFVASIKYRGQYYHIGRFSDPVEAAKAYDTKIIELRGPNAITNKSLGLL